jgi:hypothetical protein
VPVLPVLLVGGLLGMTTGPAPCECPSETPQEQQEVATYIFTGQVSDIHTDKLSGQKAYEFDVLDTFKGNPHDPMMLGDFMAGTDCRSNF